MKGASTTLALLFCATLSSCCKREVLARHPSPSGRNVLVISRANCNIGSFSTEVRLHNAKAPGGTSDDELIASINSSPVVRVTWTDDFSVLVFTPKEYDVHIRKGEVGGVRIEFH